MTLRKLVGVVPVIAVLALAAPVGSASAQAPSSIPCYPYPAFCGPGGQPWLQYFASQFPTLTPPGVQLAPGPLQLPVAGVQFGPGPVQLPTFGG